MVNDRFENTAPTSQDKRDLITFDKIWETYQAELYRFIQSRVGDVTTAEDILQEVSLKAYQSLESLSEPDRLRAWLYQIARNAIIDHARRQRPDLELPETLPMPVADETSPLESLAGCVPAMINALSEPYREALHLSSVEGLSQQVIAEQLGVSLSGVKSRVQRGRAQLKGLLMNCCRFEFDRRGSLTDFAPHPKCCDN